MMRIIALGWIIGVSAVIADADPPIGLQAVERPDAVSLLRPGVRTYQCSSHDLTGGNNDQGHFLQSINGEDVLLDVKGPGCIYRFWWTSHDDPNQRIVHIYFDGPATPLVNNYFG